MMSDSWQHAESFAVTNAHMLDAKVLCDVTIMAGEDKQEVKCHRFMLASRSPVFHTMFCGSLPEAGVVEIPDVEASVFRQVIRFMYSNEIQLMPESVMALLYAAKKYDIEPLTNRCKTFLEKEIAVDNVCTIIDEAVKFDEKDLIQQCLIFVSENSDRVFQSDGIMSISPEALRLVLERVKGERKLQPGEVYATCMKWAELSCMKEGKDNVTSEDLRQHLGDMILLVDFARMSYDSYIDNVVEDDILSNIEKVQCIKEMRLCRRMPSLIARFEGIQSGWLHDGSLDGISFSSSERLNCCSVALYRPVRAGNLTGTLEILEDQEIVLTQNVTISYKGDEKYENVSLVKEITIREGVIYSVRQRLKGPYSYYGENRKETVLLNGVRVKFIDLKHGKLDHRTFLQCGQIHGLTLKQ
ncbi:BTBD2-like protein [Mya arenaria]|uniref:BTBD2-like protein n=1 Tax=Mya arenaria TaxID=6604 RepID=A0ABY7DYE8_MYAAR|nr:BTB/POZ domain-containing protein 2-like [Mya arenaria]XP_052801690.1 BTB/POZ domain-containing protein 2-like [Mya arenaria]WAR01934.1 BTBD2-like protein [Mya arenaria]